MIWKLKQLLLCVSVSIILTSMIGAQPGSANGFEKTGDSGANLEAKREIIKILFSNIFRGEIKESILLSSKNIPEQLRSDFPQLKSLNTQIISSDSDSVCPFVFHSFFVSENKATVSFGDCHEGLGYNFVKEDGKWRFDSNNIERP